MAKGEEWSRFTELTEWIRELSAPQISGIRSAEEYRTRFVRNYARIRELSRTSRQILEREIMPLLQADRLLTDEEAGDLSDFNASLLDAVHIECVDVHLRLKIVRRLLEDASRKQDTSAQIRVCDQMIETCYYMMIILARIAKVRDEYTAYQKEGLEAAGYLLFYLEKDRFASLSEYDLKEIVLINSRYVNALYERVAGKGSVSYLTKNIEAMERALALAEDPFYIAQASKYNWKNHTFRALQGIAQMTEYCNESGADEEMLTEINDYTRQMVALWKKDDISYGALCAKETLYQSMYRNAYLAGEIDVGRFRKEILALIDGADREDFSHDGNMNMIFAQTEYMLTLDPRHLTKAQERMIQRFYHNLITYVHRMPKLGSLTFLLSYLAHAMDAFIETKGGMTFEELSVQLLCAINPQLYLHSLNVAGISGILTKHLFAKDRTLFENVPGCPDEEKIISYVKRAAMLHDVGKLLIAETIITYHRPLFEEEYLLQESAPAAGARLLEQFASTRPFAGTVLRHHVHYDRKGGYPLTEETVRGQEDLAALIIGLANDMEGMCDEVRFDDHAQMSFREFRNVARQGSGTFYAPKVTALLEDPQVSAEIETLMTEGVIDNYRNTYELLRKGQEDVQ